MDLAESCLGGVVLARFSRLDPVQHPVRARLLEVVRREPGLTAAQLARALGTHPSTVHYHARVLAHFGFVAEVRAGRERVYVDGATAADGVDIAASRRLRADPAAMALLVHLHARPSLRASEAARMTGFDPEATKTAAARLEALGLAQVTGRGARRAFRIPPGALPRAQRLILLHAARAGDLAKLTAAWPPPALVPGAGRPDPESPLGTAAGNPEKTEILRPASAETS